MVSSAYSLDIPSVGEGAAVTKDGKCIDAYGKLVSCTPQVPKAKEKPIEKASAIDSKEKHPKIKNLEELIKKIEKRIKDGKVSDKDIKELEYRITILEGNIEYAKKIPTEQVLPLTKTLLKEGPTKVAEFKKKLQQLKAQSGTTKTKQSTTPAQSAQQPKQQTQESRQSSQQDILSKKPQIPPTPPSEPVDNLSGTWQGKLVMTGTTVAYGNEYTCNTEDTVRLVLEQKGNALTGNAKLTRLVGDLDDLICQYASSIAVSGEIHGNRITAKLVGFLFEGDYSYNRITMTHYEQIPGGSVSTTINLSK